MSFKGGGSARPRPRSPPPGRLRRSPPRGQRSRFAASAPRTEAMGVAKRPRPRSPPSGRQLQRFPPLGPVAMGIARRWKHAFGIARRLEISPKATISVSRTVAIGIARWRKASSASRQVASGIARLRKVSPAATTSARTKVARLALQGGKWLRPRRRSPPQDDGRRRWASQCGVRSRPTDFACSMDAIHRHRSAARSLARGNDLRLQNVGVRHCGRSRPMGGSPPPGRRFAL